MIDFAIILALSAPLVTAVAIVVPVHRKDRNPT